jgi:hypothetical protein
MAELKIITETGMFHVACRCTWGGAVEWYGFAPRQKGSPHGVGKVDRADRSSLENHSITFTVPDNVLRSAIDTMVLRYDGTTYTVTVRDCVSFAADVARAVGLGVPRVNITPYGFIAILAVWNKYDAWT